jgi:MraZ protein
VFSGRFEHAVDGKGRTSLPARFREVLAATGDGRIILTTGFDGQLVAYPLQEWNAFLERLSKQSQFEPSIIMLRRFYVSGAVECPVDNLGRLLIPQVLRDHAGLHRDAVWAAMGLYIELWDKDRYEQMRAHALGDEAKRNAMLQRLTDLGM